MHIMTKAAARARRSVKKACLRSVADDKRMARHVFRARLKAADRRSEHDGVVSPVFTEWGVT